MNSILNNDQDEPTLASRQAKDLETFAKLENAFRLIEEAIKEQPKLKILQFDPMLRALADGLKLLGMKDCDLSLSDLMIKYEWFSGQRFFVRALTRTSPEVSFVVASNQDFPEGVVIDSFTGGRFNNLKDGDLVALHIEIKRAGIKRKWHIRSLDRE